MRGHGNEVLDLWLFVAGNGYVAPRRQEPLTFAVTLKHEFAQFAHAEILSVPVGDSWKIVHAALSEARRIAARESKFGSISEESKNSSAGSGKSSAVRPRKLPY